MLILNLKLSVFMDYGICDIAFIPVRQGLSDRSEMISQILFGECFEILIKRGDWFRIRTCFDEYEGWISKDSCSIIEKSDFDKYNKDFRLFYEADSLGILKNGVEKIILPAGCLMPCFDNSSNEFSFAGNRYRAGSFDSEIPKLENKRELIVNLAKSLINTPYLWGGRSSWGIDCSGFTQLVYRTAGVDIPRDSSQQVNFGKSVNFISDAQPGDLVFFDNEEGIIVHVGILIGNGKVIHASKKVRKDIIDHQGIYNREIKRYSHNLRVIKTILP
jgi:gamma-D-glutamyl-L-lysine dipeptidyl-peptidase